MGNASVMLRSIHVTGLGTVLDMAFFVGIRMPSDASYQRWRHSCAFSRTALVSDEILRRPESDDVR